MNIKDAYKILRVSSDVDDKTLHKQYKKLAKIYHPDNKENGDAEIFKNIKEAYDLIVTARKDGIDKMDFNESFSENETRNNYKNSNEDNNAEYYKYEDYKRYVKFNYDKIVNIFSDGMFIQNKCYNGKQISFDELKFIDGYAKIVYDYIPFEGLFGDTLADSYYNYIDMNGNLLFDQAGEYFIHYIGRNIFIGIDGTDGWYVTSPNKGKKHIYMPKTISNKLLEFDVKTNFPIYEEKQEDFFNVVVSELNKKYSAEANGRKYHFDRGSRSEWKAEWEYFALVNPKSVVEAFVKTISDFDDYSRDMYIGLNLDKKTKYSLSNITIDLPYLDDKFMLSSEWFDKSGYTSYDKWWDEVGSKLADKKLKVVYQVLNYYKIPNYNLYHSEKEDIMTEIHYNPGTMLRMNYIGRGIFLHLQNFKRMNIVCPGKEMVKLDLDLSFLKKLLDPFAFVNLIINELNMKYASEKMGYSYYYSGDECPSDVMNLILDKISEYDGRPREKFKLENKNKEYRKLKQNQYNVHNRMY